MFTGPLLSAPTYVRRADHRITSWCDDGRPRDPRGLVAARVVVNADQTSRDALPVIADRRLATSNRTAAPTR